MSANSLHPQVFNEAIAELSRKSQKRLYERDFEAWLWDVLGERMYGKMAEISNDVLFGPKPRTLVKSGNGTSKTFSAARWVLWWVTVHEKDHSLAICTAPTLTQVRMGVWSYLKEAYGYQKTLAQAEKRPMPWPGWIGENDMWQYDTAGGNRVLAVARVPGPSDAVSSFQGLRKTGGRNFIVLDEAGGVSPDIYTAIDKLMTSGDSRMAGIGNPDRRSTPFHERFINDRLSSEYQLHTISVYDTPNLTGEVVYPDDPAKEALLKKGLTGADWVYDMERMLKTGGEIVYDEVAGADRNPTGKPDGRFKSMVLGEFPGEDDRTFFSELDIRESMDRELPASGAPVVIGVDVAAMGDDESVVMVNRGGIVRVFDKEIEYMDGPDVRTTTGVWSKEDEVTSARRVHAIAKHLGAVEVRVDAAGGGSGIATNLLRLDEFSDADYEIIRVIGSHSSTDKARWVRARDENHEQLRTKLRMGEVDLDPSDDVLKKQLLAVTYDLTEHGAVKITPKRDMRSTMHGSPDRLDALIYAVIGTEELTNSPYGDGKPGDVILKDPFELLNITRFGAGMPI